VWRRGPKRKDVNLKRYSLIGQAKCLLCQHLVVAPLFFEVRVLYLGISKRKNIILVFFKFSSFALYYVLASLLYKIDVSFCSDTMPMMFQYWVL